MNRLDQQTIEQKLKDLKDWKLDQDAIRKDWTFSDFREALAFINTVGVLAEKHNHHPALYNVYNRVTLRFNTHDADGITQKDFNIASEIDRL